MMRISQYQSRNELVLIGAISADISAVVEVAGKLIMQLQPVLRVIPCSGLLKLSGISKSCFLSYKSS
jgi:hypothetical protein